eukprot:607492-Pyramimonas_sp.AAC.1
MATAVMLLMAGSSIGVTAIQIVNDQLETAETTMEDITSLTTVRIDTDEQIVNPWAASAPGDDQGTREWRGEAYRIQSVPEEH